MKSLTSNLGNYRGYTREDATTNTADDGTHFEGYRGGVSQIKECLGEKYLERFKVTYGQTLFEPHWPALWQGRCPLCSNKIKAPRGKKLLLCTGKKHAKPFVIKQDTYLRIGGLYINQSHG